MAKQTESEWKLRAKHALEVAAVDAALRELGTECRLNATEHHVDCYLDDEHGSLTQAGIGLRLRSNGSGHRLTLKSGQPPANGHFVRTEIEANWPTKAAPRSPAELSQQLRDHVEPFVLGRPLMLRQKLEVRREIRLLTESGHDVCELAIDHVEAAANGRTATFHEVELEVLEDEASTERIARALHERLSLAFADRDKPRHAAALLGIELPRDACGSDGGGDGTEATGVAVLARLRHHLVTMRRAEVSVRHGDDPSPLHDMRVAIRRMRSLVRAFRDLWPAEVAERLLGHLGQSGRQLGAVRDLDVMLELLPDDIEHLPPQLHAAGERAIGWVRGHSHRARADLQAWLRDSERLAQSAQLEQDLPAIDQRADAARAPLHDAAPLRIAKAVANLRKLINAIDPELPIGPAHRLRLAAKRVRYLAEEFAALPGCGNDQALRAIVRVQKQFGALCDHEVAAERLLGWVHAATAGSPDGAWLAAALGGLATRHALASRPARERANRSLQRADRKRVWRRLPAAPG